MTREEIRMSGGKGLAMTKGLEEVEKNAD